MSDRRRTALYIGALTVIAIASRLPQLRSSNLLVDGDEAVIGLMARHAMHGELPLFFWGQHYGFSTVEALAGALGFAAFGPGAESLKAAMLALWTLGVIFLFLALTNVVGLRRSFWITTVFVLSPAWAVWSMKARGGYLTAFAATSMLLWVLVRASDRGRWVAAGALTATIFLAQPLWLPGILPALAVTAFERRHRLRALTAAVIATIVIVVVELPPAANAAAWRAPALWNPGILGMRIRVAQQIYVNMSGSYYLGWAIPPPGMATTIATNLWCAILLLLALIQVYRLATRRFLRWSHSLFAGVCATIVANWILLFARDARYMLPLGALAVSVAGIEASDLLNQKIVPRSMVRAATIVALLVGAASLWEFRRFNFLWSNPPQSLSESKRMQQVINALTSRGVHHVFSMNGLLATQITFYSDEGVIARWASADERYPPYVVEVNRALSDGAPIAIVGYTDSSGAPGCWDVPICTGGLANLVRNPEAIFTVDGKYFVYVGGDKALLRKLKFDLPD